MQRKQLVSHFFLSVYTDKQETRVRECWKENFSLVKEDWVRGHLERLDIHKSMGPDGIHP